MSQADRIRQFVLDSYIAPARANGRAEVTIRAGDVHKELGFVSAMPAVCSAIGSSKFNQLANVDLIERNGPSNGANVYFRFGLSARPMVARPTIAEREPAFKPAPVGTTIDLDLSDAIVLVSCVKSKLTHAAQARELYTSALFRKARDIVEASGARWFILSALYGLVAPDATIAPYEFTLNTLRVSERRAWATKVLEKLLPATTGYQRVVFFAGERYREFLVKPLEQHGLTIEVPMEHLAFGEQLAWLSEHG